MIRVLVTGAGGQLAECLKKVSPEYKELELVYKSYRALDITNEQQIDAVFKSEGPFDYCINCAAYTQVDQAETDIDQAFLVNATAPGFLARTCKAQGTVLIHISTDFVFSGHKKEPYTELDIAEPTSVYGQSKLAGEHRIQEVSERFFIIRTSWLYSEYGSNFVKTMLRLAKERDSLSVVNDQIGSPTYAVDLARMILTMVSSKSEAFGIYHYSNKGAISWYDFAKKVFEISALKVELAPIPTEAFPTAAKRPRYSVLQTDKIKKTLEITVRGWVESLHDALERLP